MTLKRKLLIIMLVAAVVMAAASVGVLNMTILPSFRALEAQEASRNIQRLEQTLQAEASALGRAVNDWAKWDEMAAFTEGRRPEFPGINVTAEVLEDLNVDFMIVLDAYGNHVYETMVEDGELKSPISPDLLSDLSPEPVPLNFKDFTGLQGFIRSEKGPMLVASRSIQPTGPYRSRPRRAHMGPRVRPAGGGCGS